MIQCSKPSGHRSFIVLNNATVTTFQEVSVWKACDTVCEGRRLGKARKHPLICNKRQTKFTKILTLFALKEIEMHTCTHRATRGKKNIGKSKNQC